MYQVLYVLSIFFVINNYAKWGLLTLLECNCSFLVLLALIMDSRGE